MIDNGLVSANSFSLSRNSGKLLENLVATEFIKLGKEITYFKGRKECDFVVIDNAKVEALQVSFEMASPSTREREILGLFEACNYLKTDRGLILTHDYEEEIKYQGINISIVPAYKYFLGYG